MPDASRPLPAAAVAALSNGNKIEAIKIVRQEWGMDLKDAKDARGGIINLTVEGNRLHFEINQLAAERAGLKISSRLFSLAKIVTDDRPPQ